MCRKVSLPIRSLVLMLALLSSAMLFAAKLIAQAAPDTLVFINGEQLTGDLERGNGDGVTFKSAMAGEITVKWANIRELHSSKSFALIVKKVKLTRADALKLVPQGTVVAQGGDAPNAPAKEITLGTRQVPVADASILLPQPDFDKAVNHQPGFFHGWGGPVNAGATLVRSTQNSTSFNGSVALVRATPTVDWLPPRDRTLLNYSQSYGTTSQTGVPTVETNIFHANAERDQYFSARLFAYGSATFDHNFSQSLGLEQSYGGGIGVTVINNARNVLDFKGDIQYEKESFLVTTPVTPSVNLIGSTFSENYTRHLPHGILFSEFGSFTPSYNISADYSAHVNGMLTFPVYKGFGFSVGAIDDFLNNAPVGSNKNSSQFTTSLTYTIKPK